VKKKLVLLAMSLVMLLMATALALAQTEPSNGVQGSITSISGDVVLVEEDPASESGSAKGAFTVTGETEILRQQGGVLIPATFGDLRVGQSVAAKYAGPVAESYPTQGAAGSIVILEEPFAGQLRDDELRCLLPEGCDMNNDDVPDLRAGEPVPNEGTGSGFVQYDNAP
jgi:hypothetical protein